MLKLKTCNYVIYLLFLLKFIFHESFFLLMSFKNRYCIYHRFSFEVHVIISLHYDLIFGRKHFLDMYRFSFWWVFFKAPLYTLISVQWTCYIVLFFVLLLESLSTVIHYLALYHNRNLNVQSQQWKPQINIGNLFKVNNNSTRTTSQWHRSGAFIVNFE